MAVRKQCAGMTNGRRQVCNGVTLMWAMTCASSTRHGARLETSRNWILNATIGRIAHTHCKPDQHEQCSLIHSFKLVCTVWPCQVIQWHLPSPTLYIIAFATFPYAALLRRRHCSTRPHVAIRSRPGAKRAFPLGIAALAQQRCHLCAHLVAQITAQSHRAHVSLDDTHHLVESDWRPYHSHKCIRFHFIACQSQFQTLSTQRFSRTYDSLSRQHNRQYGFRRATARRPWP